MKTWVSSPLSRGLDFQKLPVCIRLSLPNTTCLFQCDLLFALHKVAIDVCCYFMGKRASLNVQEHLILIFSSLPHLDFPKFELCFLLDNCSFSPSPVVFIACQSKMVLSFFVKHLHLALSFALWLPWKK